MEYISEIVGWGNNFEQTISGYIQFENQNPINYNYEHTI